MSQYIYTNSNMVLNLMMNLVELSKRTKKKHKCSHCNTEFDNTYEYVSGYSFVESQTPDKKLDKSIIKANKENVKISFDEYQIHLLKTHFLIDSIFYKEICEVEDFRLKNNIEWCLLNTNGLNIINGLYEVGSNQIYIEKKKNISQSKISRFSEHSGFIYFENKKIKTISVMTGSRVESSDPIIYMPTNCAEALKVDYIFHTHPKTPYIGSRVKNGIIYEFPSISDIVHFIEHHNEGRMLGSIIITPEGIYIIRKNNFDRGPINVDYDIMIENLENIFLECYEDSYSKYSIINYEELKIRGEVKIPDSYFYSQISINYDYINKINKVLKKYGIFIDYYARTHFDKPDIGVNEWLFDNIYVPMIS